MTGSGVLTDILKLCDKNSQDTGYRSLALVWLDLILKDIQNRQQSFHWRFLEVLGTSFNTAPSTFGYLITTIDGSVECDTTKIIHVYDKTNDWTYTFVPYERFRERVADETVSTGSSYIWTVYAGQVLLWPVPSAIVATLFDYVRTLPDAADSAVELLLPNKYKTMLYDGILKYAYSHDPELGKSGDKTLEYEAGVARMISDNGQIISENCVPVSHRDKRGSGRHVGLFPLDNTNI